jgi:signal transduction histidine kinase
VASRTTQTDAALQSTAAEILDTFGRSSEMSIILPDGSIVGPLLEIDANIRRAQSGVAFTARTETGTEVVVPVTLSAGRRAVVRSLVPYGESERGVAQAWLLLGLLGISLIAVGLFVADRLARSIVRPVLRVADATTKFSEGDRVARLPVEGPREVAKVSEAFNDLADRLDLLLKRERESVADLSHRLRTPLAALRLQAEVLPDSDSTAMILPAVESLEQAVTDLIEVSRLSPTSEPTASSDIVQVVRKRADFWSALADEQDRDMVVELPDTAAFVGVEEDELSAAVDTLLENVFSHTPQGVELLVRVATTPGEAVLTVADGGPGFIDDGVVARGMSRSGSSGLGLDIVRRCATRGGGTVGLSNVEGFGARVDMTLPTVSPR